MKHVAMTFNYSVIWEKTITIHTHQTPGNGKEEEGERAHLAAALALKDV
jgi:hypothetical protein